MILAIDPSNKEHTAYCVIDEKTYKPIDFGMCGPEEMIRILDSCNSGLIKDKYKINHVAIEMVASYGMPVGRDVFETCIFIGRMLEHIKKDNYTYIYRKEVKINLCGRTSGANDTTVRKALINRFAKFDFRSGKGTKKKQDFFYGFKADVWASYAVGVTYLDKTNCYDF